MCFFFFRSPCFSMSFYTHFYGTVSRGQQTQFSWQFLPGKTDESLGRFRRNFGPICWDHPQAIRASAWPSRTWVLAGELFSTMDLCWGMDCRLNFKSHSMTIREWVPDEGRKEYTLYTVYIWLYVCIMIWYVSICQNEMVNHDRYNLHVCLPGSEQI